MTTERLFQIRNCTITSCTVKKHFPRLENFAVTNLYYLFLPTSSILKNSENLPFLLRLGNWKNCAIVIFYKEPHSHIRKLLFSGYVNTGLCLWYETNVNQIGDSRTMRTYQCQINSWQLPYNVIQRHNVFTAFIYAILSQWFVLSGYHMY